jgi:hypothetical protein
MKLHDDILAEIQSRVVQGFDNRERVFHRILSGYPRELGITLAEYGVEDLSPDANHAVREAIEEAFTRQARDAEAWPSPTDDQRLRTAFDALERQGIVTLQGEGLSQTDSMSVVADLAMARETLRPGQGHGYCFFTWNDVMRAIADKGLTLAFGPFAADPPVASEPPPPCPRCGGRGWLEPPPGSNGFATVCPCRAAATPAPAPRPTSTQKVGAAIQLACRDAGLHTSWSGAEEDLVTLPAFRWQRRLPEATPGEIRAFLDSWELELRAGYGELDDALATLEERADDWFEPFGDFGPALRARLGDHTVRWLEAERQREATWAEATVNDRLTAAFTELEARGFLAREDLGLTIQDGWPMPGSRRRRSAARSSSSTMRM